MVECPQCGHKVTFVTEDPDLGTIACVNCGFLNNTEDYVCFLDS